MSAYETLYFSEIDMLFYEYGLTLGNRFLVVKGRNHQL